MNATFDLSKLLTTAFNQLTPPGYTVNFDLDISRVSIARGSFVSQTTLNLYGPMDIQAIVAELVAQVDAQYNQAKNDHAKAGLKLLSYEMADEKSWLEASGKEG